MKVVIWGLLAMFLLILVSNNNPNIRETYFNFTAWKGVIGMGFAIYALTRLALESGSGDWGSDSGDDKPPTPEETPEG